MQSSTLHAASLDEQERDLTYLLDVFSSSCSLKDIASAYVKARHNVEMAGEILCMSHVCFSEGASSSKAKFEDASEANSDGLSPQVNSANVVPSDLSSDKTLQKTSTGIGNTRASKSKRPPTSLGTISGLIGNDYFRQKTSTDDSTEMQRPLKLEIKEVPFSENLIEENKSSMTAKNSEVQADVEEFLLKMLGDGFEINVNLIREVLKLCGYDVEKSIEKLLFMSASTLEKSDDLVKIANSKCTQKSADQHYAHGDASKKAKNTIEPVIGREDGSDDSGLEKEILEALFCVPERSEEEPKVSLQATGVKKFGGCHGCLVVEPSEIIENNIATVLRREVISRGDDVENSYEILRNSVKEYWITMKAYYKAAFDAFLEGDHACAEQFLEKGHFFNSKAHEADERSAQKLLQSSNADGDCLALDLHDHDPKEAIRTLRSLLTYLSGISAYKYLKIILGSNDKGTTKGARKRLITRQLEKESVKWTENQNGEIIMILLDVINPKRLSFSKKKRMNESRAHLHLGSDRNS